MQSRPQSCLLPMKLKKAEYFATLQVAHWNCKSSNLRPATKCSGCSWRQKHGRKTFSTKSKTTWGVQQFGCFLRNASLWRKQKTTQKSRLCAHTMSASIKNLCRCRAQFAVYSTAPCSSRNSLTLASLCAKSHSTKSYFEKRALFEWWSCQHCSLVIRSIFGLTVLHHVFPVFPKALVDVLYCLVVSFPSHVRCPSDVEPIHVGHCSP